MPSTVFKGRQRLSESGCNDFLRLAEHLNIKQESIETDAIDEGHLVHDALEEYCFGRLSRFEKATADRHLERCAGCRTALEAQREFIHCMKQALISWTASLQTAPASVPKFSGEALAAAKEKLPVSRLAGIEALRMFESDNISLQRLDIVLSGDPVVTSHLIRVANSALLSFGQEARTVNQAVARIGLERTKLHVYGLAVKRMYSTPHLQKVWNHSIQAAQVARQLAGMTRALSPDEASLVGLVHDIGHIVLANLGQPYERARTQRLARGLSPVVIEEELCGLTHAAVGADLLMASNLPSDQVEAVRHHHTPSDHVTALAALLYLAENWLDNQEDVCDLNLYRASMRRLGLSVSDLRTLSVKHSPDLELLRFAA